VPAPEVAVSLRSWLSAVGEITRAAGADVPSDVLPTRVAEQACALIGFDCSAVLLADSRGERLQVAGSAGLTADYVALLTDDGWPIVRPPGPALDTPAAQAFRERRVVAVTDALADGRYGRLRPLAELQGYRALLAVPLRTAAGLSGVVVGYSALAREFSPAEQELLCLLANQAALALENARLRTAQQEAIGELSRANEELRRGRAIQEWAERQHHALMELTLADVGLEGVVTALAETLRASVTVEDPDGRVLAQAPDRDHRAPPTAAARRRLPIRVALEDQARSYAVVRVPASPGGRPGAAAVGHPPTTEAGAWVAPVVLGGELAGRLWVVDPRVSPAPVERRVIERFALVVGLELLKRRHVADAEARVAGDLIGALLRSQGMERRTVVERAAALGHDVSRPHLLAVLAVDPPQTVGRWRGLVRAATERNLRGLVGPYEDFEVILVPAEPDPDAPLRRAHEQLQRSVADGARVTLVAGPVATGPDDLATAYRIAVGAARLRRSSRPGGFVDVRDLGLLSLLLETGTPDALRGYAQRFIEPITEHDRRRGGDLLTTLRTWLSTGCSTPDAAAELVIHPNTVAYRLAKVERLTGRNLRRPDVRMELQLAVTVHELSGAG
jgi:hypothetical protein